MSLIKVDLVIPVLDGYSELKSLFESFKKQENIQIVNIVVPITIGDDANNANKTKELCKEQSAIYFEVLKKDFCHSLIREKAITEYCKSDIVILLTQDIKLTYSNSMYNLVKDIASGEVVYTFGHQTCSKRNIEHYVREFNYPKASYIASKDKIEKCQIKAFFASDVFAGVDRKTFIKLGGYQGLKLPTNEDMLYMHSLLTNGYKAKYCADAVIEHYHSLPAKKLYKRYYDAGRFFKMVGIFDKYNKNSSGKKLAFYILKEALKHFDLITVIRWPFNMMIRYIAMKRGSR
ncbi:MAG: hypothetical protein MJ214_03765 [Bacilli bacterium]|nr:hypothetical protein [Bacilli bacterium]